MPPYLEKILSTLFSWAIFYFVSIHTHQAGHYLAAWKLNIPGYVTYSWLGGYFHYDRDWAQQYYDPVTQSYNIPWDWLVGLSGGLLVFIVFGILALWAYRATRYTRWELDDASALFPLICFHLSYAITEALGIGVYLGSLIAILAAFPSLLYYIPKLIKWFEA